MATATRYKRMWAMIAVVAGLVACFGCNQYHRGFIHFQLINQTPHNITFYAVAPSQAAVLRADNLLDEPLGPNAVYTADVCAPGQYWLRAILDVDGTPMERVVGPEFIFEGNRGWAWYLLDGEIREGTADADVYATTNLPAIVIDTDGQPIVDDPKIAATMHIAYDPEGGWNAPNGEPFDYSGPIGIELRGSSSQEFLKKSYGWETVDAEGEGQSVEVLGLPEEEDWVLHGPYMDRSMMRNAFTYNLSAAMGWYAPRTRFCEVYLNDTAAANVAETYNGVFVLTEKIKRDKNRVDIKKMDEEDIAEPDITGGYLLEMSVPDQLDPDDLTFDAAGDLVIAVKYPDPDDILDVQLAWISNYIGQFEAALFGENFADPDEGYAKYINVESFIDFIIMQDFGKNRDAFRSSTFMYKDREEKLCMGPIWDMNIAFGYYSFSGFSNPSGWFLQFPKRDLAHSPWTDRLFEDPAFVQRYIDRWNELREGVLSAQNIDAMLDAYTDELATASARNFIRWNTLGRLIVPRMDLMMYMGPHPHHWEGEVTLLREWAKMRAAWMDNHIEDLLKCAQN